MKYKYRRRANSAPSVAALSTRPEGHAHNPQIFINPKYPHVVHSGNNGNLLNGFAVAHVPINHAMNTSHLSVSGVRRQYPRRRTLSNALSISQEQKDNIELR